MTKKAIIEHTVSVINQLPEDKAEEISDFADFIFKKFEENRLTNALNELISESQSFDFLGKEEDLYSSDDLKIKYNG